LAGFDKNLGKIGFIPFCNGVLAPYCRFFTDNKWGKIDLMSISHQFCSVLVRLGGLV
jgi:hypothetical protein